MKNSLSGASSSVRLSVLNTLVKVQQGGSLHYLLNEQLAQITDKDRGLFHEMLLGTLRQWFALARITESLAHQPVEEPHTLAALHMGMYQLFYMRIPDHAAIGETVTAIKQTDHANAAGLVNAILRQCQKKYNKLAKKVTTKHSLPNWLAKQLKQDWPAQYTQLGTALREPAAIFLRINPRKTSINEYLALLTNAEIDAEAVDIGLAQPAIVLNSATKIENLPHFADGFVSVQDINAQRGCQLFSNLTNKTVLDACAAPGGKTAQLLENHNLTALTAIDSDATRLLNVSENLLRLQLINTQTEEKISITTADATNISTEKFGMFDAILLDAPCTATGVIKRHPDISLLRTEADVTKTVALQAAILNNLWQLLKPAGELIYITCSLLKAENEAQITQFLANTADAKEIPLDVDWGIKQQHGVQCLPLPLSDQDKITGDGFYFAKLTKTV